MSNSCCQSLCNKCNPCESCRVSPTIISISTFISPEEINGTTGFIGATGTFPSVTFVVFVRNIGQCPAYDVEVNICLEGSYAFTTLPQGSVVTGSKITIPQPILECGQLVSFVISGNVLTLQSSTFTIQGIVTSCNASTVASSASFRVI